jgi:omega-6 fatty acid desaturase (delta-12 desaturase)
VPISDKIRAERAAIRAAVSAYRVPSVGRSLWQIANTVLPFLALCALMYTAGPIMPYWVTLLAVVLAAGLVVRIFIIQHDCGHGSFFESRWANTLVGTACSLFTLTPYAIWRRQHAGHHAHWNNLDHRNSGADIYSSCLTLAEYQAMPRWRRLAYRTARHPIVSQILLPPLVFFLLYRVPFDAPASWRSERRGVWLTNAALIGVVLALGFTLGFRQVLLVQLPISAIAAIFGVWLFSLQHRFEEVHWARQENWDFVSASLKGSSFLKLPRVLQWFTGNIGFHHIHHLDPRVPNYRLQACHETNPMLQVAPVLTLWIGLTASTHALWDEARDRMVAFPSTTARRSEK